MKNRKKVLIVSGTFFPAISPRSMRTTELAKELSREGHEVVVYIPDEGIDYADFLKEHPMEIRSLGKLRYKDIKIKGGRIQVLVRRLFRRAFGILFEYPSIEYIFKVARHLRGESGYDTLISIAVPFPIHWGVAKVRSKRNRIAETWVADCGDPYMGDTTDSFRKPFYFKYVEKWFSRKADYITIPFEGARSAYYPEFHPKIRVIPQGFQMDHLKLPVYKKDDNKTVFGYAGGFIPGRRDPGPLLRFLSESQLDFQFIVYTKMTDMLQPYKDSLGDKLVIREYIPRDELLKVLAGMDFLVNIDNNTGTQLPSKLIDYAITGRPIFNITANTDFRVLQEFLEGDYKGRMQLAPSDDYDIRNVAANFIQLQRD